MKFLLMRLITMLMLALIASAAMAQGDRGRPKVVSIQRLGPISQTVTSAFQEEKVTGAFDVRIVLTENPDGGLTLDKIQVDGGTASNLVVGVPFAWFGGRDDNNNPVRSQALRPPSE